MSLSTSDTHAPVRASTPARRRVHLALTALIILAAASLYLLGARRVSLWDCDEAWYATSSRQMLTSGDWVITRFLDQPRYAKPIFIYWCQAAGMKLFGPNSLGARFPSAAAMTGTLVLLATALGTTLGWRRAMYTVLIFATSAMVITSAKMCLTDSVLLFLITIGQLSLFAIYRDWRPRLAAIVLWISVGLAGLTKGPFPLVVLLSAMLTLALLDIARAPRQWRSAFAWWKRLRPLTGVLIVLAIVLPWLLAAYLRDRSFLFNMLREPTQHAASNASGQSIYPGYYLATIWLTFFPWSLLLPLAALYAWKRLHLPQVRFAAAIILGNWIFIEAMVTKLPHYLLPAYSSLAFLTACALVHAMRAEPAKWHWSWPANAFAAFWAILALTLTLLPWAPIRHFPDFPRHAAAAFTFLGIVYVGATLTLLARKRLAGASAVMGGGMIALIAILFAFYLPNAQFLRLPERVGTALQALGAVDEGDVIMTRAAEPLRDFIPSLAFYQGGTIRPRPGNWLADHPVESWPTWIVATPDVLDALPDDKRNRLEEIASFDGFNYNIPLGIMTVKIVRKTAPPPAHMEP